MIKKKEFFIVECDNADCQHLQLFVARYISIPEMRDSIVAGIIRMEAAVKQFISTLPKAEK